MKNPQEDDAVERMLNQLEGLLKRQHDSARASRGTLAPVEDETEAKSPAPHLPQITDGDGPSHHGLQGGTTSAANNAEPGRDNPVAPLNGGRAAGDARIAEAEAFDPDATAPEMDAYEPKAGAVETTLVGVSRPADAGSGKDAPAAKPAAEDTPQPAASGASAGSAASPGEATKPGKDDGEVAAKLPGNEKTGPSLPPSATEQPKADARLSGTAQPTADARLSGTAQPTADARLAGTRQPETEATGARGKAPATGDAGEEKGETTATRQETPQPKLAPVPTSTDPPPTETTKDATADATEAAHMARRMTARLGQLLLDVDLLSEAQLKSALEQQRETGEKLGTILVKGGFMDEAELLAVLAKQHGVPTADLDSIEPDVTLTQMIPADMARRYQLIPMAIKKDAVDVAMVDPTDFVAMAHVRFATGLRPNVFITTSTAAERAMARMYEGEEPEDIADQPRDPRTEIKKMILDRDAMLIGAEQDPRKFYELAASIDAFVDEILRKAGG